MEKCEFCSVVNFKREEEGHWLSLLVVNNRLVRRHSQGSVPEEVYHRGEKKTCGFSNKQDKEGKVGRG